MQLASDSYYLDLPDKKVRIERTPLASAAATTQADQGNKNSVIDSNDDIFGFMDSRGMIVFKKQGKEVVEALIHDLDGKKVYRGPVSNDGVIDFRQQDIHQFICIDYPKVVQNNITSGQQANAGIDIEPDPTKVTLSKVKTLQSRPGSTRVILIDYWGGVVTGRAWTASNNNQNIPYQPYNLEGGSSSFTQNELHHMYTAWAEMAEDYAPFDVNITTDVSVFNGTNPNRRSRIIATPTSQWFGNAGGVAYVNAFGVDADGFNIGWSWNLGFGSMGMTHSHESGHQMGLGHDGTLSPTREYYDGHANWGPIMGGPFGNDYVHWSKGDYANASQNENDLTIIKGKLTTVVDDAGDTVSNATALDVSGADVIGLIRPQGLGKDTDVYVIQQGVTSDVDLRVRPLFESNNPSGTGANLSMRVTLRRSDDTVIAQENPASAPSTNVLNFNDTLTAGTYYLTIENRSSNPNPSTGFNEYGNGGYYQITISGGTTASAPNLLIHSAGISPSFALLGSDQDISLTAKVRNSGFNPATGYTITFYQSNDKVINSADQALNSQRINKSLASNQISAQFEHAFKAPAQEGVYYYGACVSGVNPSEQDTSNNCSAAQTLRVDRVDDGLCFPLKASNGNIAVICL